MSSLAINDHQKRALAVATVIALIGGALFLRDYFTLIAFAAIVAFMFSPVYDFLHKRWKSPNKAAGTTVVVALLALLIPLVVVILFSVQQVEQLVRNFDPASLAGVESKVIDMANQALAAVGLSYQLDTGSITTALYEGLKSFGQTVVSSLPGLFGSFLSILTTSIIFLYVLMSMLKHQSTIVKVLRALNPLGPDISKLYQQKTAAMTKAMVRGQFIIATAQGFADAAFLALAGLPELFFFFFVTLTALSIIPLGGGIVAMPIGVVMILTGNIWGGALVLFGHIVVVTNIDNILRPKLVPKEAKLDAALTLISVFAGLKLFGFLGIVIGPVIMILIVTTVKVYLDVYENLVFEDGVGKEKPSFEKRAIGRVKRLFKR